MFALPTYSKPVLVNILENIDVLIPGIDYCLIIYNDVLTNTLIAKHRTNTNEIEEVELNIPLSELNKQRNKISPYNWACKTDIFFNVNQPQKIQLEIQDEKEKDYLLLRFENPTSKLKDLLILSFKQTRGLLGLSLSSQDLDTTQKSLIAKMLHNFIAMQYSQHKSDNEIMKLLNESKKLQKQKELALQQELQQLKESYSQNVLDTCSRIIFEIADKYQLDISLSKSAIQKLTQYNWSTDKLEKLIENAVTIAMAGNMDQNTKIEIQDVDIITESINKKHKTTIEHSDKILRTKVFLDRYEQAALMAIRDELPLTGNNIGKYCSPPVSPAAISDSLKNHRKTIIHLLQENPNQWKTIRSKFRPVKNILASTADKKKAS